MAITILLAGHGSRWATGSYELTIPFPALVSALVLLKLVRSGLHTITPEEALEPGNVQTRGNWWEGNDP